MHRTAWAPSKKRSGDNPNCIFVTLEAYVTTLFRAEFLGGITKETINITSDYLGCFTFYRQYIDTLLGLTIGDWLNTEYRPQIQMDLYGGGTR